MTVDEIIAKMRKEASEDESTPDGILGQTLNYLADEIETAITEERSRHGSELFEAYTAESKPEKNKERFSSFDDAVTEFVNSGEASKYECPPKVVNWNWHHWNYFVIWLFTKYTPKKEVIKAKKDTSREDFLSALNDLTEKADAEEMSSIADALSEDLKNSGIEFSTENCTCDPKEPFDMPGFFVGLDALQGGTPIMWFGAGGDWEAPLAFCIYLGVDDKIHACVPREGNCFNKEKNAAFGNSGMSAQYEMETLGIEYNFDQGKMREEASNALED